MNTNTIDAISVSTVIFIVARMRKTLKLTDGASFMNHYGMPFWVMYQQQFKRTHAFTHITTWNMLRTLR